MTDQQQHRLGDLTRFTLLTFAALGWALVALYFARFGRGHLEFGGHAVGRDFVIFWTGARLVAAGRPLEVFNPSTFLAAAHAMFDVRLPFHFWSYPPTALLLVAPLGHLSYFAAYAAWNVVGLALLALGAFALFRNWRDVGMVLISPAVAVNLVMGQNGFVTAALLFAGLAAWDRKPARAGVWFGLLSFKPQLGLLLPIAALSAGRWRLIAAAAITALALAALAATVFGVAAWRDFLAQTGPAQTTMMLHGVGPFQWMTPSALMSARLLGLGGLPALAIQTGFALFGGWLVWNAYRRKASDPNLRAALLIVATFVASPQSFNYDLIPLSMATLILAQRSTATVDQLVSTLMWATPLVVVPLNFAHVPIIPLLLTVAALRLDSQLRGQRAAVAEAAA
jgi:hypothetical protein